MLAILFVFPMPARAPVPLPSRPIKAIAHLRASDPVIRRAIDAVGRFALPERPADLHMLCSTVIGQSISLRAAESVVARFSAAVGGRGELTPGRILAHGEEDLRALGLTRTKAGAIRALAELWQREDWSPEKLARLGDTDVTARLTSVKGVGPWSAKMVLIFGLRRPDVLPFEDLGLREALRVMHGLDARPDTARTRELAAAWTPWSTVGTVYAWQFLLKARNESLDGEHGWW